MVQESNHVRYDNVCSLKEVCPMERLEIDIPKTMKPPIYMYYQLTNYYQNHRRYVKSRSDQQLDGNQPGYAAIIDCEPLRNIKAGTKKTDLYFPCGLVANSWFNDTIELFKSDLVTPVTTVANRKGISWPSDRKKFKTYTGTGPAGVPPPNIPNWNNSDVENEEFIVWMRTAGLPKFRKLHRVIHVELAAGKYYLNVTNNYPVTEFGGTKSVILSTTTWLGGKNPFLGWAYIVTGLICIVLGTLFLVKHKNSGRGLGTGGQS